MFENYFGLIELIFAVLVYGGFIIWQRHSLAKDIKAREEREAREAAELASAQEESQT
ncbi:MAG: hypothetical protein AAFP99_08630 [Pseudomonadota bacterium]